MYNANTQETYFTDKHDIQRSKDDTEVTFFSKLYKYALEKGKHAPYRYVIAALRNGYITQYRRRSTIDISEFKG